MISQLLGEVELSQDLMNKISIQTNLIDVGPEFVSKILLMSYVKTNKTHDPISQTDLESYIQKNAAIMESEIVIEIFRRTNPELVNKFLNSNFKTQLEIIKVPDYYDSRDFSLLFKRFLEAAARLIEFHDSLSLDIMEINYLTRSVTYFEED